MKLIVHAPNVHTGGGRALLLPLLEAAGDSSCVALLDQRLALPSLPSNVTVLRHAPTISGRMQAERNLMRFAQPEDTVLCFGNLPPLLRVQGRIFLFLQNRLLLRSASLAHYPARVRARLIIERLWFRFGLRRPMRIVVQTPSMAAELQAAENRQATVLPFLPAADAAGAQGEHDMQRRSVDFVYVASGEPHKNHRRLIEAWKLLARDDIRPSLCLTLNEKTDGELARWIADETARAGLRIENRGSLAADEVRQLYRRSGALIFPSMLESFGLPLLEAAAEGLPILASELDYVRDVAAPAQTFDPASPRSIARAVKRHLGIADSRAPILSPRDFVATIRDLK